MKYISEELKTAIVNNDIEYLTANQYRFDINMVLEDEENESLLSYALSDRKSLAYSYFIKNSANLNIRNSSGETVVHSCIYSGDLTRLDIICKKISLYDLNLQSEDGTTPLMLSVLLEHYEQFLYLVKAGADLNKLDQKGNSAVHFACMSNSVEYAKVLFDYGADMMIKNSNGNYPLALSINRDNVLITRYLLEVLNYS